MSNLNLYDSINDDVIINAISKEDILNKITEEELFQIIFNEIPIIGKKYYSPFRNDSNPGCYFDYFCNQLRFIDWANSDTYKGIKLQNINCFEAIQIYFKLDDLQSTLDFIYNNLINTNHSCSYSNHVVINHKYIDKVSTKINLEYRKFQKRDVIYWSKYGISLNNLILDNVFPVNRYILTKTDSQIYRPNTLCYSLGLFQNNKHKLYFPLIKNFRFLTNCTQNDIGMIDNMDKESNYIVISKSYKDYRVLKNYNINSIWFQNEVTIPSEDILKYICSLYSKIYIFFDNDATGITNSIKLKEHMKMFHNDINLISINAWYKVKDISDMYYVHGKNTVTKFLELNGFDLNKINK